MRAIDSCSPIASSWSSSLSLGSGQRDRARAMSSFVTPARAERTTTTWWPSARAFLIRSATLRMRSTSPTEVPPYFWTILGMARSVPEVANPKKEGLLAHAAQAGERPERGPHRALVALVGREDERGRPCPLGGALDHAGDAHVAPRHDG